MSVRGADERVKYMLDPRHWPGRANLCARTTWLATGAPRLGAATAAIAAHKVAAAGHMKHGENPPRGAVMYWRGGHSGAGHMALSAGGHHVASTDVNGAGKVGLVPFDWFEHHWPAEHYIGWSSWYVVDLPMQIRRPHVHLAHLHFGAANHDVVKLQKALHVHPHDGVYGHKTDAAVRAHQRRMGTEPDPHGASYVGPVQAAELGLEVVD